MIRNSKGQEVRVRLFSRESGLMSDGDPELTPGARSLRKALLRLLRCGAVSLEHLVATREYGSHRFVWRGESSEGVFCDEVCSDTWFMGCAKASSGVSGLGESWSNDDLLVLVQRAGRSLCNTLDSLLLDMAAFVDFDPCVCEQVAIQTRLSDQTMVYSLLAAVLRQLPPARRAMLDARLEDLKARINVFTMAMENVIASMGRLPVRTPRVVVRFEAGVIRSFAKAMGIDEEELSQLF